MGIAIGDYRNNGLLDLYTTPPSRMTTIRSTATMVDANFTDVSLRDGDLAEPTIPFLGWGTAFIDYDNDGLKDLLVANGHVYPTVDPRPNGGPPGR